LLILFKMKRPAKLTHLANWYFGTFCYRCARVDNKEDDYAKGCYKNIHIIADKLKEGGTEMMTHKEFRELIKNHSTFCKPIKRQFYKCPICKALEIKNHY